MFHPGFADLFEAIIIVRPTAHPIEVFADNRMICVWYGEKVNWLIAVVARSRGNAEAHLSVAWLGVGLASTMAGRSPTIMSGPGTGTWPPGKSALPGGKVDDSSFAVHYSRVAIGVTAVSIEIVPASVPASRAPTKRC